MSRAAGQAGARCAGGARAPLPAVVAGAGTISGATGSTRPVSTAGKSAQHPWALIALIAKAKCFATFAQVARVSCEALALASAGGRALAVAKTPAGADLAATGVDGARITGWAIMIGCAALAREAAELGVACALPAGGITGAMARACLTCGTYQSGAGPARVASAKVSGRADVTRASRPPRLALADVSFSGAATVAPAAGTLDTGSRVQRVTLSAGIASSPAPAFCADAAPGGGVALTVATGRTLGGSGAVEPPPRHQVSAGLSGPARDVARARTISGAAGSMPRTWGRGGGAKWAAPALVAGAPVPCIAGIACRTRVPLHASAGARGEHTVDAILGRRGLGVARRPFVAVVASAHSVGGAAGAVAAAAAGGTSPGASDAAVTAAPVTALARGTCGGAPSGFARA